MKLSTSHVLLSALFSAVVLAACTQSEQVDAGAKKPAQNNLQNQSVNTDPNQTRQTGLEEDERDENDENEDEEDTAEPCKAGSTTYSAAEIEALPNESAAYCGPGNGGFNQFDNFDRFSRFDNFNGFDNFGSFGSQVCFDRFSRRNVRLDFDRINFNRFDFDRFVCQGLDNLFPGSGGFFPGSGGSGFGGGFGSSTTSTNASTSTTTADNPCAGGGEPSSADAPTFSSVKSLIESSCGGGSCHPNYTTESSWKSKKDSFLSYINNGSMPKGRTLSSSDKQKLIDYLESL